MRKLLVLSICLACAPSLPPADQPGALDAYRKAAQGKNEDPRTHEARARLEDAEWERAKSEHSIFAYRRFLEDFPETQHAAEARGLLEGLRWQRVQNSETSLQAYLEDEPRGAHAGEAWAMLTRIHLDAAIESKDASRLRAWIAANPNVPSEVARNSLDEADFRASDAQSYLDLHPDGAHRMEALASLRQKQQQDAEALEESLTEQGALQRAEALLDESRLQKIKAAADFLAALRKHPKRDLLERDAQQLYLPRATLDELPEAAPQRAKRLREWANALDGSRLHRMLAEAASPRAQVAIAALESGQQLLQGLPKREAKVRAERELKGLIRIALDGPQLAEVAVLQLSLGQADAALTTARNGRDLLCAWLRSRLEVEPGLRELATAAVTKDAQAIADAHLAHARAGDAAAVGEMCTAYTLNPKPEWHDFANCDAHFEDIAAERRAAAVELAAMNTPLARPALDRAAARDPDSAVQAAIQSAR